MPRSKQRNPSRYWWDTNLAGLSLLEAHFTTHEYPPHVHEALVIAVTEDGGSKIQSRGTIEQATRATLFVFNPMEPHAGWMGCNDRWRYRAFYLTQTAIGELATSLGLENIPYFSSNLSTDADLIDAFLRLHHEIESGRDRLSTRELYVLAFGELFARHGSGKDRIERGPRDHSRLRMVRARMHDAYAEELGLRELSANVGLTQFQLICLFKRLLGLTPHAYLTHVRLCAACRELRHGAPIAQTALASGFYDQSALTRAFRRWYGITPLQFATAALHPSGKRPLHLAAGLAKTSVGRRDRMRRPS
jgi:AraC-like DNA-binding protein